MKHKRKKQCFLYYLTRWKQHKYFAFGCKELRLRDWYRLIEIIKRGGYEWWLKEKHNGNT